MLFTVPSIEWAIEKAKTNIAIFEGAIEKERKSIREFREMIEELEKKDIIKKEIQEIQDNIEIVIDNGSWNNCLSVPKS